MKLGFFPSYGRMDTGINATAGAVDRLRAAAGPDIAVLAAEMPIHWPLEALKAQAVIARTQLLLADEPTGNVDPTLAQRLLRLFVELNRSGTSVVIATHDLGLMEQYDARRLVLNGGHVEIYD